MTVDADAYKEFQKCVKWLKSDEVVLEGVTFKSVKTKIMTDLYRSMECIRETAEKQARLMRRAAPFLGKRMDDVKDRKETANKFLCAMGDELDKAAVLLGIPSSSAVKSAEARKRIKQEKDSQHYKAKFTQSFRAAMMQRDPEFRVAIEHARQEAENVIKYGVEKGLNVRKKPTMTPKRMEQILKSVAKSVAMYNAMSPEEKEAWRQRGVESARKWHSSPESREFYRKRRERLYQARMQRFADYRRKLHFEALRRKADKKFYTKTVPWLMHRFHKTYGETLDWFRENGKTYEENATAKYKRTAEKWKRKNEKRKAYWEWKKKFDEEWEKERAEIAAENDRLRAQSENIPNKE